MGVNYKATFLQAMQFCDIMYMKLLTIESEEENAIIHKYIVDANKGNDYWTAGSNMLDSRNYVWMGTGKTLEYRKWENNEPNIDSGRCISVVNKNDDLLWNNIDCGTKLNYICQLENTDEIKTAVRTQPLYSPNINLLQSNGKSYYFSRYLKLNYLDAAFFCRMLHMTLITIDSEEENHAIGNYIRNTNLDKNWWTAGTRVIDNVWIWLMNGKHIEYSKWANNQPNNDEKCIVVINSEENGLEWYNYPCNEKFSFICEKRSEDSSQRRRRDAGPYTHPEKVYEEPKFSHLDRNGPEIPFENEPDQDETETISDSVWRTLLEELPPGFIAYTYNAGKKFHVETEMWATQKQAKLFCEYHGMQLMAIESELENNITKKVLIDVDEVGPFWIGAKKPTNDWRWLGIARPLTYKNLQRHTNLATDGKTCLAMLLNGEWRLEECEALRPFICEATEPKVDDDTHMIVTPQVKAVPEPAAKRVCAVKPIINVYVNNNLVSPDVSSKVLTEGHKNDGKYSVDIKNNFD